MKSRFLERIPSLDCSNLWRWIIVFLGFAGPVWVVGEESEDRPILKYAAQLFEQGKYEQAAKSYDLYLRSDWAKGKSTDKELFMLGESYHKAGKILQARSAFERLLREKKKGHYVGNAAYRLGGIHFREKDYRGAKVDFELASREASTKRARYQAKYYNARSLQFLHNYELAIKLYAQLLRTNPGKETYYFFEKSRLETALIYSQRGDTEKALLHYKKLSEESTIKKIREEAIVRKAMAALKLGDTDAGEKYLKEVKGFDEKSPWYYMISAGDLFVAYERKDFKKVIRIYNDSSLITNAGEFRDRVLFITADAYRKTGDPTSAARIYTLVAGKYSKAATGIEAGYRRLVMLYQAETANLPDQIYRYTRKLFDVDPESPFIDKANLLLGEWHFFEAEKRSVPIVTKTGKKHYLEAAEVYSWIDEEKINDALIPQILYHQCWSLLQVEDIINGDAIVSRILVDYPQNEVASKALAKRAETYFLLNEFKSARVDYQNLTETYPDSKEAEIAMERIGRIDAHQQNHADMVVNYTQLLARYPDTTSKAEANFWIGIGYFEQEKYAKAIPYFLESKRLDRDSFSNKAGIRLIFCYNNTNQVEKLIEASHVYIQSGRDAGVLNERQKSDKPFAIPRHILTVIGKKLAHRKEYQEAEYFLTLATDPENPNASSAEAWKSLGTIRLKLEKYVAAVTAFDYFVTKTRNQNDRGFGYLSRGQAQLALGQTDNARKSAREVLRVVRNGRVNADARLLLGDILKKEGDWEKAILEYQLVGQLFDDYDITPRAFQKIETIYLEQGRKADAERVTQQLAKRFPEGVNP